MTNSVSGTIASMEDEIRYLTHELDTVKRELAVIKSERDRLQIENSLIASRARASQDKATRVETILSQVSMGLVSGLSAIREGRDVEQSERRQVQQQEFDEESRREPPPAFLRREGVETHGTVAGRLPPPPPPPPPRTAPTTAQLRAPLDRPGVPRIDQTLASLDRRLPGGPEWGQSQEPEIGSLEDMAQNAVRGGAR